MIHASRSGLVLLDKEAGLSSFAALGALRRALRGSGAKVGHTGTLDPFATGLLVAVTGSCTRLAPWFTTLDKTYRAVVRFGAETSTLDPEGDIVATSGIPSESAIRDALPAFIGDILQAPPAISAVHIDGERAWKRARRGEAVLPPPRPVRIHGIGVESFEGADLTITVRCSSGTYIRALARDLALACGARASLSALRRLSVGPFRVEDAEPVGMAGPAGPDLGAAEAKIRPFDAATAAAMGFSVLPLDAARAADFRNGRPLDGLAAAAEAATVADLPFAAFAPGGAFLGLVSFEAGTTKYHMVAAG